MIHCLQILSRKLCIGVCAAALTACGSDDESARIPSLGTVAALGEKIFHDVTLSASGQQSCAHCHRPEAGHAAGDTSQVTPPGGDALQIPGFRNPPSLRYLSFATAFHFDTDGTPTGGFNRDGMADTLQEQAARPFLAAHEMANSTPADVIAKLRSAPYAQDFLDIFGANAFDDPALAFERVRVALERYQLEDLDFRRFDSKYDLFLDGQVALSDREGQGLILFNDPSKGNCAACHPSERGNDGSPPLFTDFTYDNIGVPRNPAIAANSDPAFFDLGLCGPFRTDLAARTDLCGAFKVPTLRNVAITAPYFHNGRFATLKEAVGFYVRRDTNPEQWYPRSADGSVRKFDDLPQQYHGNVNVTEAPYDRLPGQAPALTEAEIDLVVEFLGTLTDGYRP